MLTRYLCNISLSIWHKSITFAAFLAKAANLAKFLLLKPHHVNLTLDGNESKTIL